MINEKFGTLNFTTKDDDLYIGAEEIDIIRRVKNGDKLTTKYHNYNEYTEVAIGLKWESDNTSIDEWSLSQLEDKRYILYKGGHVILTDKAQSIVNFFNL